MRQKQQRHQHQDGAYRTIKDIRRQTRRRFSAEEKIRIVLAGLRGEDSIAELCRQESIAQSQNLVLAELAFIDGKLRSQKMEKRASSTGHRSPNGMLTERRLRSRRRCFTFGASIISGQCASSGIRLATTASRYRMPRVFEHSKCMKNILKQRRSTLSITSSKSFRSVSVKYGRTTAMSSRLNSIGMSKIWGSGMLTSNAAHHSSTAK